VKGKNINTTYDGKIDCEKRAAIPAPLTHARPRIAEVAAGEHAMLKSRI
jgi:hypothetical protein